MDVGSLMSLVPVGGGAFLLALVNQARRHVNDSRDRRFARHVFDETESTEALEGYTRFVEASRRDGRRQPSRPQLRPGRDDAEPE